MSRVLLIFLALAALVAGAVAWSGGSAQQRADFTFINRGDIITLDINQMSYLQDFRITYAIREGLYGYNAETLVPEPALATSMEVSSDKRVYTFHLRPEGRWSNGDPVVADDFVFAWRRMLETPGEYTYLFYYIKGAETYLQDYAAESRRDKPDFKTVGIEALDGQGGRTLRVTLTDPVAFFLDLVAFPPFYPLNERSMEPFKEVNPETGRVTYNQKFTRPPAVVTNGPFILKSWEFKRRLWLERDPKYWDSQHVKSRSIEMEVVEDPATAFMRYDAGDVDWLSEVPSEIAPELMADSLKGTRPDFHNFPGFGTAYLTVMVRPTFKNGTANPLSDIRIRQALAMALDKKQIVQNITRMGEIPTSTFVPPGIFPGYIPRGGHPYDPPRAKRLLSEAGYPNGGRLPGVTFLFRSDNPVSRTAAQNYTHQWKEKLNLDIPLESVENKIARARLNDKDYALAASNWIGDYGDPSTFTDKYRSNSDNNDSAWINKTYDDLLYQAAKEPDVARRMELLEQAEKLLNDQAAIIPLYHVTNQYLFRAGVHGINLNPRNTTIFKAVYVQR